MINNANSCAESTPLLCHGTYFSSIQCISLLTVFCRDKVLLNILKLIDNKTLKENKFKILSVNCQGHNDFHKRKDVSEILK